MTRPPNDRKSKEYNRRSITPTKILGASRACLRHTNYKSVYDTINYRSMLPASSGKTNEQDMRDEQTRNKKEEDQTNEKKKKKKRNGNLHTPPKYNVTDTRQRERTCGTRRQKIRQKSRWRNEERRDGGSMSRNE